MYPDVAFAKGGIWANLVAATRFVEVFAMQDVFEVFHAIDLMLALFGADKQADVVPLADGFGGIQGEAGLGINGRLVKRVKPAAADRISRLLVVFELKFRAGNPRWWGLHP